MIPLHKLLPPPDYAKGPIPGNNDEPCSSQQMLKPIISPRPSILRKRDAEGVLKAQRNLIPIITRPDPEDCRNMDAPSIKRNRCSSESTGLQRKSVIVPQVVPEVILPRVSALSGESHMLVEISPRRKPRKQLLPVNQGSPIIIVDDEMEYVDEEVDCNDDCADAEDEAEDDLDNNEMDVDNDSPVDDDHDEDDDDFEDGFDNEQSDETFFEKAKTSAGLSNGSSSYPKLNYKRLTLWAHSKSKWCGTSHHFLRYTDVKIKEAKKQLAEIQLNKRWLSDSKSVWKVQRMLKQFDEMVKMEEELSENFKGLIDDIEVLRVADLKLRHDLVELCKCNIQRCKVAREQLEEIIQDLTKLLDYKILIDDIVVKYSPKNLEKKISGKA